MNVRNDLSATEGRPFVECPRCVCVRAARVELRGLGCANCARSSALTRGRWCTNEGMACVARALGTVCLAAACAGSTTAPTPSPNPVTGARAGSINSIDHVSFIVSNLAAARHFYGDLLGLEEVSSSHTERGAGTARTAFRVGTRQRIEIEEGPVTQDGRLGHVAFAALGLPPGRWSRLRDPDGHQLEIVGAGRSGGPDHAPVPADAPRSPDYQRLVHVGVLSGSLASALAFYQDRLGFKEFWRGGSGPARLDWVNMRVPGGEDYVELMLYEQLPLPADRGGKNHVCLFVADVAAAVAAIEARPARRNYARPLEIKVGRNRKRQVNLFDPDGTRVELMEPQTVDGHPAPPSTAPPPRP
jgi:catechol 2,3-dioxygenase-like lactoylglutathione lyase family enzyme